MILIGLVHFHERQNFIVRQKYYNSLVRGSVAEHSAQRSEVKGLNPVACAAGLEKMVRKPVNSTKGTYR